MAYVFGTFKSINDLENAIRASQSRANVLSLREKTSIALIDDNQFEGMNNLKNHHYKITYFPDIDDISQLEPFHIVLCDLAGVGTRLNAAQQGAHLIKEIKMHYPEKFVIAYSGGVSHSIISRRAEEYADKFLKKDADIDDWVKALDYFVLLAGDPVYMWKKFRNRILDAGVTPIDLTRMEDQFVSNYGKGYQVVRSRIEEIITGLPTDLRGVVQGFIASAIFKMIAG